MSSRVRLIAALAIAALVISALAAPNVEARKSSKKVGFATPTVVDNFRPGFEPDLGVDLSPKGKETTYTSFPFGFSTTQSMIYRSDDHRKSFHLIEGSVAGKPGTCAGGGDSEIKIDPVNGHVYFVDLQGLTNFSASESSDKGKTFATSCNSVNGTAVDRQWLGIDTNGGKDAVGDGADGGRLYLDYDNVDQNTDPNSTAGNQLVMNGSLDGVHYGSFCQTAGSPCAGPPAVASPDEGIPGNIVVDSRPAGNNPFFHRVYAIHTSNDGDAVIVSYCSGADGDKTAAQVAQSCTDPTQVTQDPAHVNVYWHDSYVRKPGPYGTGYLFAAIAMDNGGNLFAVWSEYPSGNNGGSANGPGVIKMATSTDGAKTWSDPIDVSPKSLGNNVMPWITAGDRGRIDIAWYGAPQAQEGGNFGPDTLDHGTWNLYMAQSLNALASHPKFTVTKVSDHQNKFGNISTQGLGGSPDRSLGDFLQITHGTKGEAIISYVDDTSADRNPDFCGGCGQTPAEAAGPIMIATQNRGPSLYSKVGTVRGPKAKRNKTRDKKGDAAFYSAGTSVKAAPNLDIKGASMKMAGSKKIKVTLKTADKTLAKDLMVDPSLGGPVGEWLVRWAAPTYDTQHPGDGNIFYVGMESAGGGAPEFYTGTTAAIQTTHAKYFVYPKSTTIPGKIKKNKIVWKVPLKDVGKPAPGQGLYSVTGFTVTQVAPSTTDTNGAPNGSSAGQIPNTIDLAPAFTFKIPKPRPRHLQKSVGVVVVAVAGLGLLGLYSWKRRRIHELFT